MSNNKHCKKCDYKWRARKEKPKECPRCKIRLDYPSSEASPTNK